MRRVFLLRHPHVQAADEGICYGSSHAALSPLGEEQAQNMVEFFRRYSLGAVYASDLPRAAQPARLVAQQQGLELQLVPQLQEVDCGEWEGLSYDTIQEQYPGLYEQWFSLDDEFYFPGGESLKEFRARVLQAFREIVQGNSSSGESNIAIVSHGGVNRMILLDLLQLPLKASWQLGQDFAAVNIIEYHSDYAILKLLNGSCQRDKRYDA